MLIGNDMLKEIRHRQMEYYQYVEVGRISFEHSHNPTWRWVNYVSSINSIDGFIDLSKIHQRLENNR